jgi:hypothetical protein
MKKIFLIIVCIIVIYGLLIFLSPETSSKIESLVGFPGITENIRWAKTQFDDAVTDIPTAGEFKSWALDIKDSIKWGLDTTKEKIDGVRSSLSSAEDTLNDTLDTIDTAVETVSTAKDTVNDLSEKAEALKEIGNTIRGE